MVFGIFLLLLPLLLEPAHQKNKAAAVDDDDGCDGHDG